MTTTFDVGMMAFAASQYVYDANDGAQGRQPATTMNENWIHAHALLTHSPLLHACAHTVLL